VQNKIQPLSRENLNTRVHVTLKTVLRYTFRYKSRFKRRTTALLTSCTFTTGFSLT